jgi:folate-binding protein YgfZ
MGETTTKGYRALRESAAWFDVSTRGRIQAAGEDRARLLHAMTTNHIQELTPGGGVYAFFLNAQGRILADVYVFCRERDFLLDTEPRTRQSAFEHLDQYIIMDDVTLEDVSGQTCELAVEGPASADLLSAIVGRLPEKENCFVERNGGLVARVNATGAEGWRLIAPVEEKDKLAAQLEAAGAVAAAAGDVEIVRLEHGRPLYGVDFGENTIPHETQLMHALHFNKGCYLGQEIVERVRSRGLVNRVLVPLRIDTAQPPGPGAQIDAGDKKAGTLTSAAFSPAEGRVAALGLVRTEYTQAEVPLTVGGAPVVVVR